MHLDYVEYKIAFFLQFILASFVAYESNVVTVAG